MVWKKAEKMVEMMADLMVEMMAEKKAFYLVDQMVEM